MKKFQIKRVRKMVRFEAQKCSVFFSTLSNPTRLALLELLLKKPMNVSELSTALSQDQSLISHNLKPLLRCGLVFRDKRWRNHIYSVNSETVENMFKLIEAHRERYCKPKGFCPAERG